MLTAAILATSMVAAKGTLPESQTPRPDETKLGYGTLHVEQNRGFVCIKLTRTPGEADALANHLLDTFIASGMPAEYGVPVSDLRTPQPPPGDKDVGPHVSIFHYTESDKVDYEALRQCQKQLQLRQQALKIDRVFFDQVIFTSKTRAASNSFLVEIESRDLMSIREQIGLKNLPKIENGAIWHPHITVAIVPREIKPYPVVPKIQEKQREPSPA